MKSNITRNVLATLSLVAATPAFAGWDSQHTFTVTPQPAHAEQPLFLRVDSDVGCFTGGPQAFVTRQGGELTVKFYAVDHACPPEFKTPLMAAIGAFGAGTYSMQIQLCAVPPLGCVTLVTQSLVVEAPLRQRVPFVSVFGLVVLAGAVGVTVAYRRRAG